MINFIEINDLPIYDLYNELNTMIYDNRISWSNDNQICLNTITDRPDDIFLGCGSLTHDWNNSSYVTDVYGNQRIEVPEYEIKYTESDFVLLCSQFTNTLFEDVYNRLKQKYNLGRVRVMKSKPKSCLSWHTDAGVRVHYPIKTQGGCFMVIDDEVKHLPLFSWWETNTIKPHTAVNSSKEDRIHLVVDVLSHINL